MERKEKRTIKGMQRRGTREKGGGQGRRMERRRKVKEEWEVNKGEGEGGGIDHRKKYK